MAKLPDMHINNVMGDTSITFKIKATTVFGWRMRLAIWFIEIAAAVCPVDSHVSTTYNKTERSRN